MVAPETPSTPEQPSAFQKTAMRIWLSVVTLGGKLLAKWRYLRQRPLPMLEAIVDWTVLGGIVVLLISVGFGVLSMTPPRHRIAEVCFCVAATIFWAKFLYWAATSDAGLRERLVTSVIVFAVSGSLLVWALSWIEGMLPKVVEKPPFAIEIPTSIFSLDKEHGNGFWLGIPDTTNPTIFRVNTAIYLTLANLKSTPVMITEISAEMKNANGDWVGLVRVPTESGIIYLAPAGLAEAYELGGNTPLLDRTLAGHRIEPDGTPVGGWLFFEYPRRLSAYRLVPEYRVTVKETTGERYTSGPLGTEGGTSEPFKKAGVRPINKVDLSLWHQRNWTDLPYYRSE